MKHAQPVIDVHSHTYHTVAEAREGSNADRDSWRGFQGMSGQETEERPSREWTMLDGTPKGEYFGEGISVSQVLREMDEAQIDKTCILGLSLPRLYGGTGDEKIFELYLKPHPDRFIGFAGIDPVSIDGSFNRKGLVDARRAILDQGFRGLKMLPVYTNVNPKDGVNYPFYELAAELKVPITIHQGMTEVRTPPAEFGRPYHLDRVLLDFPSVLMNVAHLGWPWEEEVFALMVKHPNLYADISMISDMGWPRLARDLAIARDQRVIDRVLFGTDAGGRPPRFLVEWIRSGLNPLLEKLGLEPLTTDEIDGVLGINATRFLNLA